MFVGASEDFVWLQLLPSMISCDYYKTISAFVK